MDAIKALAALIAEGQDQEARTMAGIMVVTACGSSTSHITPDLRSPMAYAASDWPAGTASTPARTTSASTDPLYMVNPPTSAISV